MNLFREAFAGKYAALVNAIEVESGLWTELQTRTVLTPRQLRDCRHRVCDVQPQF